MRAWVCVAVAVGLACAALACPAPASGGEYTVTRAQDAPFAFPSIFGGTFNKGSSLVRESVILNDPDCPVQISKASTAFELAKSNFTLVSATDFTLKSATAAISIRHVAFDVFGQHMENLVATDVSDRKPGPHSRTTRWSALGDLIPEMLTTVTYVARVRLSDGTQWSYDESKLLAALARLKLEARLGDSRVLEAGRSDGGAGRARPASEAPSGTAGLPEPCEPRRSGVCPGPSGTGREAAAPHPPDHLKPRAILRGLLVVTPGEAVRDQARPLPPGRARPPPGPGP